MNPVLAVDMLMILGMGLGNLTCYAAVVAVEISGREVLLAPFIDSAVAAWPWGFIRHWFRIWSGPLP